MFTGLLFGPIIATALLYSSVQLSSTLPRASSPLPAGWLIEPPAQLVNPQGQYTALEALVLSRYNLVDLATFCSTLLLFHVCASWWIEARYRKCAYTPEGERGSVPRSEGLRSRNYVLFTFGVSLGALCIRALLEEVGYGIWQRAWS
jgi:dolichol kinase